MGDRVTGMNGTENLGFKNVSVMGDKVSYNSVRK